MLINHQVKEIVAQIVMFFADNLGSIAGLQLNQAGGEDAHL
ncbi:MAG: hypothetical protein ACSLEL_05130 [Candidatus Malihini olakiniferum]